MSVWRAVRLLALAMGLYPQAAPAQVSVDSMGIASAVARLIAEELVAEIDAVPEVMIGPAETRFDSLVAAEMARYPVFQRPLRDPALAAKISTRGFGEMPGAPEHLRGLPAVIVRVTGCTPSDDWGGGHWWANQTYYVFRQTADGWELAGGRTMDNADGRCTPREQDEEQR